MHDLFAVTGNEEISCPVRMTDPYPVDITTQTAPLIITYGYIRTEKPTSSDDVRPVGGTIPHIPCSFCSNTRSNCLYSTS